MLRKRFSTLKLNFTRSSRKAVTQLNYKKGSKSCTPSSTCRCVGRQLEDEVSAGLVFGAFSEEGGGVQWQFEAHVEGSQNIHYFVIQKHSILRSVGWCWYHYNLQRQGRILRSSSRVSWSKTYPTESHWIRQPATGRHIGSFCCKYTVLSANE